MKLKLRLLFPLLCLLTLLAVPALAASTPKIYATCPSAGDNATVQMRIVNTKCTLSLPGSWDATQIVLSSTSMEQITIDGTVYNCNEPVDLSGLLGRKVKLKKGNNKTNIGTLTILQGSYVPTLHITVDSKQLSSANHSKDTVITEGDVLFVEADGTVTYDGTLETFHGRGNSTFMYTKKPYQLKLSEKTSLAGMDAAKTWILLANWSDLSLIRSQIMYDLCADVGLRFAIDCSPVDVWINGIYNGLYLLCEKVQIGTGRVEITNLEKATEKVNDTDVSTAKHFKVNPDGSYALKSMMGYKIANDPEDITGGYIIEMEKSHRYNDKGTNGFRTNSGIPFIIKEPTYASEAQVAYIGGLVNDFQLALRAEDGVSPVTGTYYADYINTESFALKYVLEEFCKNYDSQGSSQFFYKDSDSVDPLLYAGPCWDYDLCFGNARTDFYNGSLPTLDHLIDSPSKANLYWLLWNHDDFSALVKETWYTRLAPLVSILVGESEPVEGGRVKSLDAYAEAIAASAEMNFERYPESTVQNYYEGSGNTHEKSVAYLKKWISQRFAWMNDNWAE